MGLIKDKFCFITKKKNKKGIQNQVLIKNKDLIVEYKGISYLVRCDQSKSS